MSHLDWVVEVTDQLKNFTYNLLVFNLDRYWKALAFFRA